MDVPGYALKMPGPSMEIVTPVAFRIAQLIVISPAEPPVQSSVFGTVKDRIAGFVFGVAVGRTVGFAVALGVGVGVGVGVRVGATVDEGGSVDGGTDADGDGVTVVLGGRLGPADGATLATANSGGEAVASADEPPRPTVNPKMTAPMTPTTTAMSA